MLRLLSNENFNADSQQWLGIMIGKLKNLTQYDFQRNHAKLS